jgi:hypothetical protein
VALTPDGRIDPDHRRQREANCDDASFSVRFQARESSDKPILKAFCRVAPSLRFRLLAIFLAGVFLRAADFNSRTSEAVQERRFEFLLAM